jgi:uncharacterized protein YjiK
MRTSLLILLACGTLGAAPCESRLVPLREPLVLGREAPQGITQDGLDGSFWISFGLNRDLLHLSPELAVVEIVPLDLPPLPGVLFDGLTGIAYNPDSDALFVVRPVPNQIWEVDRRGAPTGRVIQLALPRPPNIIPEPFPKGIAYDPEGDHGRGSIWLVEGITTSIYEVDLEGSVLASFCHHDDPDGCPGNGLSAPSSDVKLFADGGAFFLDLVGGDDRRDRICRVDTSGVPTGVSILLQEAGGVPSGFLRADFHSASGKIEDALYVLAESSSELHVHRVVEPSLLPILDLECATAPPLRSVDLSWRNTDAYERIEVRRDGDLLAVLGGAASSFTDDSPLDGVVEYEVRAVSGECSAAASCSAVVGPGSIVRSLFVDGRRAVDLAEDSAGRLWVTFADNTIDVYDKDLRLLVSFLGPFQGEDDVTSGIDYDPVADAFYLYNNGAHTVAAMDLGGELIEGPFPSGVVTDPENEDAAVPALLFNPAGNGGAGSFWYLEILSGTLQERARDGTLLQSCVHPDTAAEPPPPDSTFAAFAFGLTAVPGAGFELFEVSGGRIRDLKASRVIRVSSSTCEPTGPEVPLDALSAQRTPFGVALHRTTHDGAPRLYAIDSRALGSWLYELDASLPIVPAVAELSSSQPGAARDIALRFRNPGGLDLVEVFRDGVLAVTLPGGAAAYDDTGVPSGVHTYGVRGRVGANAGARQRTNVRVGPGSLAAREFAFPVAFITALAYDRLGGRYLAATSINSLSSSLHVYDLDLRYDGAIPSPFRPPFQVAALAVREVGGSSEVYCLGWIPGAQPGEQDVFPLRVIDGGGRFLRELAFEVPPPRPPFVTFPSGLAWDAGTDSFFALERNSATVFRLSPRGALLESLPHPAPLHQDGVINYGLEVDAARGVLFLASAGRLDLQVTKLVELTRSGVLTGVEVPLDAAGHDKVWGFARSPDARGFVVAAGTPGPWDLVRVRAFEPLDAPLDLDCETQHGHARLAWRNPVAYDAVVVFRGAEEAAVLDGAATSWADDATVAPRPFYRVAGRRGGLESAAAVCEPPFESPFARGEVQGRNGIDLSDAVSILGYLFLGGRTPACLDAADVDDSGSLEISDAVRLLNFLFLGGAPPAQPWPERDYDPTPDGLTCLEG